MCFWDVWSQALLITVQHRTPRLPHCSTDPRAALGERSGCQAGNEFPCGLRLMKWGLCLQGGQGVRPLKNPRAGQDWACQLTGPWLTDGHVRLNRAGWIGYWTVVHLTWNKQHPPQKKGRKVVFSDCDSPSSNTNSLWPVHHKSNTPPLKTTLFMHTALCHSFTSGLTLSSTEPGKRPEVVKMGAGDISQLSEHAQSVFSSLTLQPGQGVYLMAKTLSRTHHNSDGVGVFPFFLSQTCPIVCVQPRRLIHKHNSCIDYIHTYIYANDIVGGGGRWQSCVLRGLISEMD